MIKLAAAVVLSLVLYVAIGVYLPSLGRTAVVVPLLASVPAVGAWICSLSFKGLLSLLAYAGLRRGLA